MTDQLPQLHMRRRLESLPELVVPPGYRLRTFGRADAEKWAAILAQGEFGEWNLARALPYFAPDSQMAPDGSFFITRDDEPVATAQLHLHVDDRYAPVPELGWVGASAVHRGHGLGYVVCLAVLRYAASVGHREIFLRTEDFRLPALATYLRLGFEPWMYDPSAPGRWQAIREKLAAHRSPGPRMR